MSDSWQLRLYDEGRLVHKAELTGPVELGRQSNAEEALYSQHALSGRRRVVIALKDQKYVSRRHVLVQPLAEGGFQVTNLAGERPIGLPDRADVAPQMTVCLPDNALLTLGDKTLRLRRTDSRPSLRRLPAAAVRPGAGQPSAASLGMSQLTAAGVEMKAVIPWLQAAMDVLQSAATSADFFDKAARAVVDLVNLDSGRVLLLKGEEWQVQALHTAAGVGRDAATLPSRHVLDLVRRERRGFWQPPGPSLPGAASLDQVDAVAAAPILDRTGAVVGVLYGDRSQGSGPAAGAPLTEVEGMLVEVLARGVAAGLARLEQEQAALAARVQFEQFFSPDLARRLAEQPDLLQGRDAEVTILFCDVRGFSRIAERLGPVQTLAWIGDVLETVSDCVRAEGGVLVDYTGDELMAMWGAPEEQPDHARRACRAALDMLRRLPGLSERWQKVLQTPTCLGVGVNTGPARVGNTGCRHKYKYGPLGSTVNLASRVQGATRYLKCSLLITEATRERLDDGFAPRRLCRVRAVNIAEPAALYELAPAETPGWAEARAVYEEALEEFENRHFANAARILGDWRVRRPADGPALLLLSRAVQCMVEEPTTFDPVWVLPGK
jgi:adenylate cyclase